MTGTPTVPIGHSGLEGWTSCCEAAVTYHDDVLCCKACWQEVEPVALDDNDGADLARVITAVIDGTITGDQGVARQREILDRNRDAETDLERAGRLGTGCGGLNADEVAELLALDAENRRA